MKIMTTLAFSGLTLMASAEGAEAAEPSMFEGPNFALALIAMVFLVAILSIAGILKKITSNPEYFVKLKQMNASEKTKAIVALVVLSGLSTQLQAQDAAADQVATFPAWMTDPNTVLLLCLNALLLGVFIYITRLLLRTISMLMPETEADSVEVQEETAEAKFMHALTDAIPLDREHEVMLDHEYDGIRELDNNLPPWWVWMFYATIVFAVVYLTYYHVLPYGETQAEEYIAEVEQAEVEKAAFLASAKGMVDENSVEYLTDAADLKAGKGIYVANCQVCHAADGGGGVGPNFADAYWIHGGSIKDIFKTIKYGVPTKGMISWEAQLRPIELAQVSSYVMSLGGTTPLAPKEPQGELYAAPGADAAPAEEAPAEEEAEETM